MPKDTCQLPTSSLNRIQVAPALRLPTSPALANQLICATMQTVSSIRVLCGNLALTALVYRSGLQRPLRPLSDGPAS